jgi:hypothetical protein
MLDSERQYDELIAALTNVLDQEPPHVIALNNRGVALWERAISIEHSTIWLRPSASIPRPAYHS